MKSTYLQDKDMRHGLRKVTIIATVAVWKLFLKSETVSFLHITKSTMKRYSYNS
jgi:hypothetical protein